MAIPITYTDFQRIKRTISDIGVISRRDISTVIGPLDGDSYLASATAGIFVINRLYVFNDTDWFEAIIPNGQFVLDELNNVLYQGDSTNIPQVFLRNQLGVDSSTNSVVQAVVAGTRTKLSNFLVSGAFTADKVTIPVTGVYGLNLTVSTSNAGSLLSIEILFTNDGRVASTQANDVGLNAGCAMIVPASAGHIFEFYATDTLGANLAYEAELVRIR